MQLEYNSPNHGPNNYPFEFELSKSVSTIDGTFLSNYDPSIQYLVEITIEKVESSDKSEITTVVASPEAPPYDDIYSENLPPPTPPSMEGARIG